MIKPDTAITQPITDFASNLTLQNISGKTTNNKHTETSQHKFMKNIVFLLLPYVLTRYSQKNILKALAVVPITYH